ncbi:MAG: diguanylate cyclase [Leptolyngbyaceae cyanobacterium]
MVVDEIVWPLNQESTEGEDSDVLELQTQQLPPVVLLTDRACPNPHTLGLNPEKDDYVLKPFTSDELIARMEAAVKASADLTGSCSFVPSGSSVPPAPSVSLSPSPLPLLSSPSLLSDEIVASTGASGSSPSSMSYRQTAYQRIQILESILDTLQTGTCSMPLQHRAIREAHTLAGTLANLGLEYAAQFAEQITALFKMFTQLNAAQIQQLSQAIQALRHSLESPSICSTHLVQTASTQVIQDYQQNHSSHDHSSDNNGFAPRPMPLDSVQLLIVDDDVALSEEIRTLAAVRNIHTRLATTLSDARSLVQYYRPDIVLLDLCFPNTAEDGLSFLAELTQIDTSIPVIVFTSQQGLTDRLNAARLGAKGFLQKPISANGVFDVLTRVLQQHQAYDSNLLVMVDDEGVMAHLDQLLTTYGFSPTLHRDPDQFWTVLENVAPDLLILDVNSKRMNGLELCRVVRNDIRWSDLPIILLAEQTDRRMVQEVFAAGADDYVQKPICGSELMARVSNRLERSRLLNTLAYTDSLTGLTNRCKATADIKRLLYLAERQQKPMSFVIFDLDRFKQINDQHGHLVGDQALRHAAYALQQTFRRMDVIARWGGDEFVLGLFDSSAEQTANRITQLMQALQHTTISTQAPFPLTLTCSVGIAEYPLDGHTLDDLYQAADKALYHSKLNGRNCISLAQALHP